MAYKTNFSYKAAAIDTIKVTKLITIPIFTIVDLCVAASIVPIP